MAKLKAAHITSGFCSLVSFLLIAVSIFFWETGWIGANVSDGEFSAGWLRLTLDGRNLTATNATALTVSDRNLLNFKTAMGVGGIIGLISNIVAVLLLGVSTVFAFLRAAEKYGERATKVTKYTAIVAGCAGVVGLVVYFATVFTGLTGSKDVILFQTSTVTSCCWPLWATGLTFLGIVGSFSAALVLAAFVDDYGY